jgi:hypothetical protein
MREPLLVGRRIRLELLPRLIHLTRHDPSPNSQTHQVFIAKSAINIPTANREYCRNFFHIFKAKMVAREDVETPDPVEKGFATLNTLR